jgi:hypothetical protein
MKVAGPTVMDLTNPTTVTFAATAAFPAIEGVFNIESMKHLQYNFKRQQPSRGCKK